jgi:hypothetical protein
MVLLPVGFPLGQQGEERYIKDIFLDIPAYLIFSNNISQQ